jgi:hypothetical protein
MLPEGGPERDGFWARFRVQGRPLWGPLSAAFQRRNPGGAGAPHLYSAARVGEVTRLPLWAWGGGRLHRPSSLPASKEPDVCHPSPSAAPLARCGPGHAAGGLRRRGAGRLGEPDPRHGGGPGPPPGPGDAPAAGPLAGQAAEGRDPLLPRGLPEGGAGAGRRSALAGHQAAPLRVAAPARAGPRAPARGRPPGARGLERGLRAAPGHAALERAL